MELREGLKICMRVEVGGVESYKSISGVELKEGLKKFFPKGAKKGVGGRVFPKGC